MDSCHQGTIQTEYHRAVLRMIDRIAVDVFRNDDRASIVAALRAKIDEFEQPRPAN